MMATTARGSIAQKVTLSTGLNLGQQFIVVVTGVVVARLVGPEGLGIVAYASAYMIAFQALSDLGFGPAHVKRISEGCDLGQCIGMMWIAKLVGLVLMTAVVLGSFWAGASASFPGETGRVVFFLSVGTLVLSQLSMVPITTLTAFQDVIRKDGPATGTQVFNGIARVLLVIGGLGAIGLAIADFFTSILLFFTYAWLLRKMPIAWPSRKLARSYLVFGIPMFIIATVTGIGAGLDRVFLELFSGAGAVGQYSAGMRLGAVLNFLSVAVGLLVFPSMSRAYADGRPEEAFALCGRAERQLSLVLFPVLLGITLVARPTADLLLGSRYLETGPVIVFGTAAMIFQALTQPYRQIINAAEKLVVSTTAHVGFFGFQTALLYLFVAHPLGIPVPVSGAPAAGVAAALASIVGAVLWRALAQRALGARLDRRTSIHVASAAVLFVPADALASGASPLPLVTAFVLAIAFATAHLGVLRLTGELGAEQIEFLRGLVFSVPVGPVTRWARAAEQVE